MTETFGMHARNNQRGFTLVELMIALVILSILTTIAVSTFSNSGRDAERARIVAEISALNDALARYYQGSYTYTGATVPNLRTAGGGTAIAASPEYDVTLDVADDGQAYMLWARPSGGGSMVDEGAYSINEVGQRCTYPGVDNADENDPCEHSF